MVAPPFKLCDKETIVPELSPPLINMVQPVVVIGGIGEILNIGALGGFGRVVNLPPVNTAPVREFNVVLAVPVAVPQEFEASTCAP